MGGNAPDAAQIYRLRGVKERKLKKSVKGGPGSGFFGHVGRPGKRGGSVRRTGPAPEKKVGAAKPKALVSKGPKQAKGITGVQGQVRAEPMTLINGKEKLTLRFDCKPCEMHVIGRMKPGIFKSPPPGSLAGEAPLHFHRHRPV